MLCYKLGSWTHAIRNQNIVLKRCFASKKYTKTLNLPKTSFALSMKDGVVPKRELDIQKTCGFSELYNWQKDQKRDKDFILHDGPPYANGDPHVGHLLNKVLKDITNRYKLLRGYRVHYQPGWDCHGVPIEQKALAEIKGDHRSMEPTHIRHTAKKFAEKAIRKQMAAFKRWGVMADWDNCYYTFNKQYEADQLGVFFKMYEKGLVYEDYMPVHWSPSSRTALAEGELEYNDKHISTSVYVKFPLCKLPDPLQSYIGPEEKAHVVIWTTTPWTLPTNCAISFGSNIKYSLVKSSLSGDFYIVCSEFVEKFSTLLKDELNTVCSFEGNTLNGSSYTHPIFRDKHCPLLPANHVTTAKGTGLVHTAPAHGQEDFQVAVNHKLPLDCIVNEDGLFMEAAGPELCGKAVLEEGNTKVLSLLEDWILLQEPFEHSYPYDWRTKQPVILRASKQWFVNTSKIRNTALDCLNQVSITPGTSGQGMLSQLNVRTYWCISRQRVWGVPIPVFYQKNTREVLLSRFSLEHIQQLVKEHGTDCWWTLPIDQLLPRSVIQQSGFDPDAEYVRATDVLDIWFDSGASWSAVLNDVGGVADLYLEGLDQFGGWFQSSLLTSVAVQNKAPYRALAVHGFTMDETGKKMSKSLGNVVDPDVVINGGKNRKVEPAYGVDVLRWCAAQSNWDPKVHMGPSILERTNEQIYKVRKSLRYLMGNLHDFDKKHHSLKYDNLLPLDQYMLHLLYDYTLQVSNAYDKLHYGKVLNLTEKFINTHVSSFYCHITKDRLYCSNQDDRGRRSSQTVLYLLLEALTKTLAPIAPHFAEEVFQYHPFPADCETIFKTAWFEADPAWLRPDLTAVIDVASCVRDVFFGATVAENNPVEFDVVICAKHVLFEQLKVLQQKTTSSSSCLNEMLQCSRTSLLSKPPLVIPDEAQPVEGICQITTPDGQQEVKFLLVILPAENFLCERCRRHTAKTDDQVCQRCNDVLTNIPNEP